MLIQTIIILYNLTFRRRPAWTDRILFKCTRDSYRNVELKIEQNSYKSHPNYTLSDHKPVTSEFVVQVRQRLTSINRWLLEYLHYSFSGLDFFKLLISGSYQSKEYNYGHTINRIRTYLQSFLSQMSFVKCL